nr:hypothetical protein [Ktedonobacter sp. SOSP1-85]
MSRVLPGNAEAPLEPRRQVVPLDGVPQTLLAVRALPLGHLTPLLEQARQLLHFVVEATPRLEAQRAVGKQLVRPGARAQDEHAIPLVDPRAFDGREGEAVPLGRDSQDGVAGVEPEVQVRVGGIVRLHHVAAPGLRTVALVDLLHQSLQQLIVLLVDRHVQPALREVEQENARTDPLRVVPEVEVERTQEDIQLLRRVGPSDPGEDVRPSVDLALDLRDGVRAARARQAARHLAGVDADGVGDQRDGVVREPHRVAADPRLTGQPLLDAVREVAGIALGVEAERVGPQHPARDIGASGGRKHVPVRGTRPRRVDVHLQGHILVAAVLFEQTAREPGREHHLVVLEEDAKLRAPAGAQDLLQCGLDHGLAPLREEVPGPVPRAPQLAQHRPGERLLVERAVHQDSVGDPGVERRALLGRELAQHDSDLAEGGGIPPGGHPELGGGRRGLNPGETAHDGTEPAQGGHNTPCREGGVAALVELGRSRVGDHDDARRHLNHTPRG